MSRPAQLSAAKLSDHLSLEPPEAARLVRALRRAVLKAAPEASEAIKFRVLCYFHADAYFGSIGGNICMIEVRKGKVVLTFIHGAHLPDPDALLTGKQKFKRLLSIPDATFAKGPAVARLVRAAAELRPWD